MNGKENILFYLNNNLFLEVTDIMGYSQMMPPAVLINVKC
jgi:hypothetical protein